MSAHRGWRGAQRALPLAVAALLAAFAGVSSAEDVWITNGELTGTHATIESGVAVGVTGALGVNQAAGVNNAQANSAVIANGGGLTAGTSSTNQQALVTSTTGAASAAIQGNAFSGTSGLTQVNQASGAGNLQRNATVIVTGDASGVASVSDTALSAAISKGGPAGRDNLNDQFRTASISGDAFRGASGVVQVNQSAGIGNVTANVFVLRPPAGTSF
ncbi:hypothetical protein [Pandoraea apista]|uniref:hypothetical protein n=1 Tax=Pandoraea apista TaxID=93218 RepID=UPI00058A8604|nr:hypothetical protein [Pandoraea apista]AJE99512.1 hypothetical protein SG18_17255 [Pandoraea apista]AKH73632.1 hypothetical protein XM39_17450 [Pandoraea apista]AKI62180.1 hypothetical protein AA956_10765 [Pandoraea apista]